MDVCSRRKYKFLQEIKFIIEETRYRELAMLRSYQTVHSVLMVITVSHVPLLLCVLKMYRVTFGIFFAQEDEKVIELVEKYGPKRWTLIAKHLKGRIGKQCRERWHNHLNPAIKKSAWTEEEDRIIYEAHKQWGNQWAKIAKLIPGRSVNTRKISYGKSESYLHNAHYVMPYIDGCM